MTTLRFCTLTGVDAQTDLLRIAEMGKLFPFSEWGVLFNPAEVGKDPRYTDLDSVWSTGKFLQKLGVNCAVHLCGRAVRQFVQGDLLTRTLTQPFGRVQLNLLAKRFTVDELSALADRVQRENPGQRLILQMNRANAALCQELAGKEPFEFLFDSSGGRGLERTDWPSLALPDANGLKGAACGFAGGLGPDNISDQFARIQAAAAGRPFWVDMEGKLRNADNAFDLDKAEVVLRHIETALAS